MNPVITPIEVSDGMNFNNVKSGIIIVNHDIGELKLNAYQNGVDLSHQENEGEKKEERKNFALDVTKWGKMVTQNMVMFNRLELGDQNDFKYFHQLGLLPAYLLLVHLIGILFT